MKRSENPNDDGILQNKDKADKQVTLDEKLKHHQEMLTAYHQEDNPLEEAIS